MAKTPPTDMDRYSRQVLFQPIGTEGQRRLMQARVVLIGCGALGTVIANTLVRAGIGYIRICDRDYVEPNNLQRQILFDEADIERNFPKAIAATNKLKSINSQVEIEPVVVDVNHTNVERLIEGTDLILDGTDNFETRYLLNDVSVKSGTPWVYGAVIGASGLMMPIVPGKTPCLRCVFENAPPPEMSPTCDTAGVIAPAVNVVASFQTVEAMKLLTGRLEDVNRSLASIDVWSGRIVHLGMGKTESGSNCVCCGQRNFEYLNGKAGSTTTTLCGRDAVQINPPSNTSHDIDFEAIAAKLAPVATGRVTHGPFMLRATVEGYTLSVFSDGRAIVKGTQSADEARTVYSKYIGN